MRASEVGTGGSGNMRPDQEEKIGSLAPVWRQEEELVGFFPRSDLVFLDLETLGLSAVHPIFLIGVFYFDGPTP